MNSAVKKKTKQKIKGFSLIEIVIGGFILAAGVVAVLGLMASNLSYSFGARNHEIASLLAQEGVELARNIRDNNWASSNDSFNNFPGSDNSNCRIDMSSTSLQCGGSSKGLNLSGGFYVHSGGTATRFSRKIEIDYQPGGDIAEITSIVIWKGSLPNDPNYDDCNASTYCAFTRVSLGRWGED